MGFPVRRSIVTAPACLRVHVSWTPALDVRDPPDARPWRGLRRDTGKAMTVEASIEAFLEFYAEDVVCYPARGWIEGDRLCHGHDGFRGLAEVWTENIDDGALEVHEVRDLRDRVLVLAEFTGRSRSSGEPRSQRFGAVNSDLRGDGRVGEVRFYLTWQEARDAVGLVR